MKHADSAEHQYRVRLLITVGLVVTTFLSFLTTLGWTDPIFITFSHASSLVINWAWVWMEDFV